MHWTEQQANSSSHLHLPPPGLQRESGAPLNPPDFPGWNPNGPDGSRPRHALLVTPVSHHPSWGAQMFLIRQRRRAHPQTSISLVERWAFPMRTKKKNRQLMKVYHSQMLAVLQSQPVSLILTQHHCFCPINKIIKCVHFFLLKIQISIAYKTQAVLTGGCT